ncbi:MAG TPA: hypothetical protein VHA76_01860 [Solirubrobacterales bacterium]|nr:hypothetical protein [Solirubrobacterales bacterium]
MADPGGKLSSVPVRFDREEWAQEVERLDERSESRIQAEKAIREIESGKATLDLRLCEGSGGDRTSLPGCAKLYLPLGRQGASDAPFGFVFQLAQDPDGGLVWNFLAFGERHPDNSATRTVYERAHKRLHGRYP